MTTPPRQACCSAISGGARQISTELRVLVRSGSAATTFKYGFVGDTSRGFLPGVAKPTYHRAVWLHTASAKIQAYFRDGANSF